MGRGIFLASRCLGETMRRLAISAGLLLAVLLAVPSAGEASSFSQLIVYGDSLSDNGNIFAASGGAFPPAPYAQRMSNGPVAVEYMAATLGLPLVDLAFAGATTGTSNVLNGALPGMLQELLGGPAVDPSALYVVWGGANDFLSLPSDPVAAATASVANLMFIVDGLTAGGAQEILVPGLPDLSLTPRARALDPATQIALHQLSQFFNGLLLNDLLLRPNTTFFDTSALLAAIVANPATYGFTNATDACKSPPDAGLPGVVCADVGTYVFFDDIHPTTAGHATLGGQFAAAVPAAVPEPSSILLVVVGVAEAVRRRTSARRGFRTTRGAAPRR